MLTRRFVRFAATGVFNTLLHAAIAAACIHFVSYRPSVANGVAFVAATVVSFFINTLWSFSSSVDRVVMLKFVVVALIGLPIAAGVSGLVDALGFPYQAGIAAVVCVMPPVNFLLHHFWTYRHTHNPILPIHESPERPHYE